MDKLLKTLTKNEKAILADLFEHDAYKVLKKLLENRQLQIAQTILSVRSDHEFTTRSRGEASEDAHILNLLEENFKQVSKDRNLSTSD